MKYILLIVMSLLFISCAKEPVVVEPIVVEKTEHSDFIVKMISEYSLGQSDLQKIQFYTSHDIVLHKQTSKDTVSVYQGTLHLEKASESDEIVINAGTPCLFLKGNDNVITVEFDNNITLNFASPCANSCAKTEKYYLAADSWVDDIGTLSVHGEVYKALGVSGKSYLMIDKKSLENNQRNRIVLKGKKVQ